MKSFSTGLKTLILGVLGLASLPALSPAQTAPAPAVASSTVVGPVILRDESIDQVLVLLERWTGKTILRPQALPNATLTLTLKGNVTREEAIRALETLLTLNGIAISPLDDQFLKVTALTTVKSEAPELIDGSTLALPPSGRIVSKVFQLNFLRVSEFMPQIAGLLNPAAGSAPVVFESANAALVTDSLSNLQRVETLLAKFDQPRLGGLRAKFYPLHFAKASEVVAKMHTILAGPLQTQLGSSTTYNPDDRTNQIVLVTDPRQYEFFDDLVAKLDVKSDANTRNDVIYLKYAAAKDVASSLTQLVTTQNTASRKGGSDAALPAGVQPPAPAGGPQPAPAAPAAVVSANLKIEPSNQFSSLLTILPEERSNAIIVSGTEGDIRLINELIAKIDIILAQVRIEVVIAEVTLGDSATSGISALGLKVNGDKLVEFSGSSAGLGVTGGVITRPGVVGAGPVDLAGLVSLNTTPRKSNANILSVPTILTTHGKEGKIFVGESRPVISSYLNDSIGTGTGTTSTGSGYRSTVNSKDIGIQLSVKPLIGNDGAVQLEIKQEVNDVLGDITIDGNPQPRIGKRSTESFITAKSGEIIVLGGMQRTSQSRSTSRLGPIPIIGDLLGSRTSEKTRTDLVFFLRPTVLTNSPTDNAPALKRVEEFPKEQREQVKKVIAPAATKP
jgi:general secretion pathway protein D